jgi:hypothetical protein
MRIYSMTLAAILLTAISTNAMAEWIYLTSMKDMAFDVYVYETDIFKKRKKNNKVKIWHIHNYKTPQTDMTENYLSEKIYAEYDCIEMKKKTLNVAVYTGNMGEGKVIKFYNFELSDNNWMDIPPETLMYDLWKTACGKK